MILSEGERTFICILTVRNEAKFMSVSSENFFGERHVCPTFVQIIFLHLMSQFLTPVAASHQCRFHLSAVNMMRWSRRSMQLCFGELLFLYGIFRIFGLWNLLETCLWNSEQKVLSHLGSSVTTTKRVLRLLAPKILSPQTNLVASRNQPMWTL